MFHCSKTWHSSAVDISAEVTWITVPDVCERLGISPGKVHRLVEERYLLGRKSEGVFRIPEVMLQGNEPVKEVRGTLVVLLDGGFDEDSPLEWLLGHHELLGVSPIEALRAGRKTEVRRIAQSLAL